MSDKRYTAQNMREMANEYKFKCTFVTETLNGGIILNRTSDVRTMLLQAASAEEELAKVKARLDAVVKECEKSLGRLSCTSCRSRCKMNNDIPECENPYLRCEVQNYNAILRVARGEGGAE